LNTAAAGDASYTKILTIECKAGYVAVSNKAANNNAITLGTAADIGGCYACFGSDTVTAKYKTCKITTALGPPVAYTVTE